MPGLFCRRHRPCGRVETSTGLRHGAGLLYAEAERA